LDYRKNLKLAEFEIKMELLAYLFTNLITSSSLSIDFDRELVEAI
jgi:hypothetical protein